METKLPLHVSQVQQPQATINRLHTLVHSTALLALLYYRFSSLDQQYNTGSTPFSAWLLISFSELLHSFLWVLGQATRWRPMSRTVYPERLPEEKELPAVDVFICTADAKKEPTLGVMNTVISAMCLDYPPEKLFVYVSDDGGAPITLYGMKEAYKFARKWIPFCKKYGIETRAPDAYFSGADHEEEPSSEFGKHRNEVQVSYKVYKQNVERARESGGDAVLSSPRDRPSVIQVIQDDNLFVGAKGHEKMPLLIYVSREKSRSHPHNFKAGALNVLIRVSGILSNSPYILFLDCDMYCKEPTSCKQAMCFHLDPQISSSLAFVQFPHTFHNVSKNDIYNDLLRVLFKIQLRGIDGLRGPILSGSCLYLKREALFRSPKQKDLHHIANTHCVGCSTEFIASLHQDKKSNAIIETVCSSKKFLEDARLLASCTYEKHTLWGEQIGFMYHTVVEDYFTGFFMHCKGWISVYCYSSKPTFLGNLTTNLSDTLIQTTRWNSGLLQVGFSKFSPLVYGMSRMSLLQSMCYASFAFQSLSALPILCYAIVPQLCLFNGITLYPKVSDPWFLAFAIIFTSWHFQHIFEVLSTGGSLKLWWNHLRIMIIKSITSSCLACLDVVSKLVGAKQIEFVPTNKEVDGEQDQRYKRDVFDFRAGMGLLLPLTTIVSLNLMSLVLGLRKTIYQKNYENMFAQLFLSLFIVILNYPIIGGMILRKDNGRIPTHVTIITGVFSFGILSFVLIKDV